MGPWVDASRSTLVGCSFTHPVSLEHLYARCCFRPWEHDVEQDTVPALLEFYLPYGKCSQPGNEEPHETPHAGIRTHTKNKGL